MAETAVASTSSSSPKKVAKAKKAVKPLEAVAPAEAEKPAAKPHHPSTPDMVIAAIKTLNERGGSSLHAIKKYILTTYNVNSERSALLIRRYLKSAVTQGTLIQTKGKGASGSFKLPPAKLRPKATKKSVVKIAEKPTKAEKVEKPAKKPAKTAEKKSPKVAAKTAGKSTSSPKPKKAVVKKTAEQPASAKTKVKSPSKNPSKVKKTAKSPTKPKAPKPKKAIAPKAAPSK